VKRRRANVVPRASCPHGSSAQQDDLLWASLLLVGDIGQARRETQSRRSIEKDVPPDRGYARVN
jgi:hypothetical protein